MGGFQGYMHQPNVYMPGYPDQFMQPVQKNIYGYNDFDE